MKFWDRILSIFMFIFVNDWFFEKASASLYAPISVIGFHERVMVNVSIKLLFFITSAILNNIPSFISASRFESSILLSINIPVKSTTISARVLSSSFVFVSSFPDLFFVL